MDLVIKVNNSGVIGMVSAASALTWESFTFTEVSSLSRIYQTTTEEVLKATDSKELTLPPVPVRDNLNVSVSDIDMYDHLEIIDMTGKVVLSKSNLSNQRISIDVSALTGGVYLLKAHKIDGQLVTKRFTK